MTAQPLPPYPLPGRREDLLIVLGEQHHRTLACALTLAQMAGHPERGLYTSMAIIGATD